MNIQRMQVESLDQFRIMAQRPVDAYILLDVLRRRRSAAASVSSISIIAMGGIGGCMTTWGIVNATTPNGSSPAARIIVEAIGKAALYVELELTELNE